MKPPPWLTEAFARGVTEQSVEDHRFRPLTCFLGNFDELRRPCSGRLERFHFIPRKDVSRALGDLLPWGAAGTEEWNHFADLIQLAEWDSRNGEVGCEGHHRRFDSHLTPTLILPGSVVPDRLLDFITDYGLESEFERRFGADEVTTDERITA